MPDPAPLLQEILRVAEREGPREYVDLLSSRRELPLDLAAAWCEDVHGDDLVGVWIVKEGELGMMLGKDLPCRIGVCGINDHVGLPRKGGDKRK